LSYPDTAGLVMLQIAPRPFLDRCADAEHRWDAANSTERLWARDATLWTGHDEDRWLGWLDLSDIGPARVQALTAQLASVRALPANQVLLIGMGGSSLGAEVMARVLPRGAAGLPLHILDTLVPAAVLARFAATDWARTIVVVASKSGGTLEPAVLLAMVRAELQRACGDAGVTRIIAITDPGSALHTEAVESGFGAVILGRPEVGGRFSILSPFGLVPALLLDAPVAALRAAVLEAAAAGRGPTVANDAVRLGLALATAVREGRDKATVLLPASLAPLGAWIEQLVAESIGKHGTLLLPVVGEPVLDATHYGADHCVVHVTQRGVTSPHAALVAALAAAGHPTVGWEVAGPEALWAECFRWELATAVAGAALGVHPFDQPDVEASKTATRALSAAWEADGVPEPATALALPPVAPAVHTALAAWLGSVTPGDYVAVLAWLPMSDAVIAATAELRAALAHATHAATTVGFGPRYLHSTGQAFKGGPNTGCFVSLISDEALDAPLPGRTLSLGSIARAQREGELAVLRERGRRVLELTLRGDAVDAIRALTAAVQTR
jgi:transaldolase/glucose-6-phosphate isomerase